MGHPCFQGLPSSDPALTPQGGMGTPRGRTENLAHCHPLPDHLSKRQQLGPSQRARQSQSLKQEGPPHSPARGKTQAQKDNIWLHHGRPSLPAHGTSSGPCSHLLSALWGQRGPAG